MHQPHMILADEPTAAVDQFTAIEIRDSFRAIAQSEGIGLVMVTHDRNLVNDCADTASDLPLITTFSALPLGKTGDSSL